MNALLFCPFWGRVWDFLSVRGAGESAQDRLQGRGSPSPALLGVAPLAGSLYRDLAGSFSSLCLCSSPWGLLDLTLHLYHGS